MKRFEFRIRGLAADRARSFRSLSRFVGSLASSRVGPGLLVWSLALLLAYGLLERSSSGQPSVAEIGQWIRATEMLVLVDNSGSMNEFLQLRDQALESIRAAETKIENQVNICGSRCDILETIAGEIERHPGIDAIWLLSDFHDGTDLVIEGDAQRYEKLVGLLRRKKIRLFLSTVDQSPTEDQIRAALASGGAWSSFRGGREAPPE